MIGAGAELIDEPSGRTFGFVRRLGAGGFGEVWLARSRNPSGVEQLVAVKLLRAVEDRGQQAAERLRDEAMVLANLHHPAILVAHDLVELDGVVALVTEYVDGEDLGQCIHHPADPLPLGPVVEVTGQVAAALDAAWRELSLVHRDVKPENIRIGRHGNVKLLDFGISRSGLLSRSARTTQGVLGSAAFLAPERFHPERPPHPGSDIFSLGCVLYEGATGEALYEDMDMAQVFAASADARRLDAFVADRLARGVPEPIVAILDRVLRFDPDARPDGATLSKQCDATLALLKGSPPLRIWARDHPWTAIPTPPPPPGSGEAPGTELVANTWSGTVPEPLPLRSTTGLGRSALFVLGVTVPALAGGGAVAAVAVAVVLLIAGGAWVVGTEAAPDPEAPPSETAASEGPRTQPKPEARPEAPERGFPARARAPEGAPAPSPRPSPQPRAPEAVPASSPPTVAIEVDSPVPVELRDGGGRTVDPARAAGGVRYQIFADFGLGPQLSGEVRAGSAGEGTTIRCNVVRQICTGAR